MGVGASNVLRLDLAQMRPNYAVLLRVEGERVSYSVLGLEDAGRSRTMVVTALESLLIAMKDDASAQDAG